MTSLPLGEKGSRVRVALTVAAAAGWSLALLGPAGVAGCSKEPEKKAVAEEPPPPQLPPPPPPPRVDFASLGRELGASPKLTYAPTLAVSDAGFARAAVRFADALAKGDEKALSSMMSPRARSVLGDLAADGRLAASLAKAENIHLVYADVPMAPNMERTAALAAMSLRVTELRDRAIADARARGASEADARRVGAEVEFRERARLAAFELDASGDQFEGTPPSKVLLMAVQELGGAYLIGWAASGGGDSWTFETASTLDMSRARAEHWEDIGPAAFTLQMGKPAAKPAATPAPSPAPEGGPAPAPAPGPAPAPAGPAPAAPMTPGTPISPH